MGFLGARREPPEPPASVGPDARTPDPAAVARETRRRNGLRGFPWFFTKQLIGFSVVMLVLIIVDFAAMAFIAVAEEGGISMAPAQTTAAVSDGLAQEDRDGAAAWVLSPNIERELDRQGCWAVLLQDGTVVWSHDVPFDVPRSFSVSDIAVAARQGKVADYPCFFWDKGDGLLVVVGYPKDTFADMALHLTRDQWARMPLYVLGILSLDALILFLFLLVRRQRTRRATVPIAEALDDLASGRPVQVTLGGDLREVGRALNEASAMIRSKDEARERWIIGVSHDIRTPLSMIVGQADAIASADDVPESVRKEALLIRSQSQRIADLVQDLNTASRLEYDTQPLDVQDVALAPLVRKVAAEYLNDRLPAGYELEVQVLPGADEAVFRGDRRLMLRAVQNLVQNAIVHNPQGCSIAMVLGEAGGRATVTVSDDGVGVAPAQLAALAQKLAASSTVQGGSAHGLGLVLVKRIAEVHGGTLAVGPAPQGGFQATVELPLTEATLPG